MLHYNYISNKSSTTRNNFSSFIILTFIYKSTCFGCPHAHHQELNNCSSSLWFYCWSVVVAALLFVFRPWAQTRTTALLSPRYRGKTIKPDAATAVVELPMMGVRMPDTCWAVNKRQDNKTGEIVTSCWWFIRNVWWCTGLQTLNLKWINTHLKL